MRAKCPFCGELQGPLANDLLTHLKDAHQKATEWWDASTNTIKLRGWLPATIELVEDKEEMR